MLTKLLKIFLFATLVLTPSVVAYGQYAPTGPTQSQSDLLRIEAERRAARRVRFNEELARVGQIRRDDALINQVCASGGQYSGPCSRRAEVLSHRMPSNEENWSLDPNHPLLLAEEQGWRLYQLNLQTNTTQILDLAAKDPAFTPQQDQISAATTNVEDPGRQLADQQVAATAAAAARAAKTDKDGSAGCMWNNYFLGNCVIEKVLAGVGNILLWVFKWILYAANELFNIALNISILDFKNLAEIGGVRAAWVILRDAFNIIFIAALIYVAIGTILQISTGEWKKLVVNIIIAALLINFSMVFAKVIIDASNLLSLTFYEGVADPNNKTISGAPDITSQIFRGLKLDNNRGLDTTDPSNTQPDAVKEQPTIRSIIVRIFGNIVIVSMMAFVLLVAAALFIVRTVVLVFLLILSPVAFLGRAMPFFKKYSDQWWTELTKQCTFAPVYMFLFYVVIKMIGSNDGASGKMQEALGNTGAFGTFIYFTIVLGLLSFTIIVAQQSGAIGSKAALAFGQKWAGKAVAGVPAWALRNTAGRVVEKIGRSQTLQNIAGKGGVGGVLAMGGLMAADKFNKSKLSSFDIRNSPIGTTFGMGKGAESYQKTQQEQTKTAQERAKLLGPSNDLEREESEKNNDNYLEKNEGNLNEKIKVAYDTEDAERKIAEKALADDSQNTNNQTLVAEGKNLLNNAKETLTKAETDVAAAYVEKIKTAEVAISNATHPVDRAKAEEELTDIKNKRDLAISNNDAVKKAKEAQKEAQEKLNALDKKANDYAVELLKNNVALNKAKQDREIIEKKLESRGGKSTEKIKRYGGEDSPVGKAYIAQQKQAKKDYESGKYNKLRYAESLDASWLANQSTKEGAAAIRKEAKGKSKAEQLLEDVEKKIKEENKSDDKEKDKPSEKPKPKEGEA